MAEWRKADGLTTRQMLDLPPVWLVGFIVLVWTQVWLWPWLVVAHPVLWVVGGVLFWAGLGLILWTLLTFMRGRTSVVPHQTPVRILTSGPFRHSRNPIYLGDLMVLAGVVLSAGAWPCLVLIPLLIAILSRRFIAQEEARMKQSFGAEFDAYVQKTRRWL